MRSEQEIQDRYDSCVKAVTDQRNVAIRCLGEDTTGIAIYHLTLAQAAEQKAALLAWVLGKAAK
jgi:hypothetical protein